MSILDWYSEALNSSGVYKNVYPMIIIGFAFVVKHLLQTEIMHIYTRHTHTNRIDSTYTIYDCLFLSFVSLGSYSFALAMDFGCKNQQ